MCPYIQQSHLSNAQLTRCALTSNRSVGTNCRSTQPTSGENCNSTKTFSSASFSRRNIQGACRVQRQGPSFDSLGQSQWKAPSDRGAVAPAQQSQGREERGSCCRERSTSLRRQPQQLLPMSEEDRGRPVADVPMHENGFGSVNDRGRGLAGGAGGLRWGWSCPENSSLSLSVGELWKRRKKRREVNRFRASSSIRS